MRIRIIKNHKKYSKGQIVEVSNNVGFGLIDSGNGILTKDIVESDIQTKKPRKRYGRSA